jgi:hypothetical protein
MSTSKGSSFDSSSDTKKKSRKKGSKWTGLKGGLEFSNRLVAATEVKKKGEPNDPKKKGSKWNLASKVAKKEESPMNYGMMMSVASFSIDATDGLADFKAPETVEEGKEEDWQSDEELEVQKQPEDIEEFDEEEDLAGEESAMPQEETPNQQYTAESGHDQDFDYESSEESDYDEDHDIPFLSPMKVLQLKIEPGRITRDDDLAVSVHSLSGHVDNNDDLMVVHHMETEGRSFENVKRKRPRRFRPTEEDVVSDEDDGQSLEKSENDGHSLEKSIKSSISLASFAADEDLQPEYDRLVRALEESQVRTKVARKAVKELQQEIQRKRQHYGEVENRKQTLVREMKRHGIEFKRTHQ